MDQELALANQRIDNMSFKDLTTRAATAMTPNPAKPPAKKAKTKSTETQTPEKPGTS